MTTARHRLMACQVGIKVAGLYMTEYGTVAYVPSASSREAWDLHNRVTVPMDLMTSEYLGTIQAGDLPCYVAGV